MVEAVGIPDPVNPTTGNAAQRALFNAIDSSQHTVDPSFWDNIVGSILNRLVGTNQRWSKIATALDLPKGLHPDREMAPEDWTAVAKKLRPTEGWGGVLGDTVATLPLMALPGGPVAGGAASGAVSALTEPTRGPESAGNLALRTGFAAGAGGAFGLLGKWAGGVARRSPEAFNREVINAAAPPGAARIRAVGQDGIAELQTAWEAAYARITPHLRVTDNPELRADLAAVLAAIPGSGAPIDTVQRVQGVITQRIDDVLTANNGTLTGDAVNRLQSRLREVAEQYPDIEVPINAVRDAFLAAAQRSSPQAAEALAGLRAQYPAFITVQKAAAKSTTNAGVFTPDQLAQSITATDTMANKGATAAGQRPFQQLVNEARDQGISKASSVGRLIPIIGRGERIAQESPILSGAGAALEKSVVPVVGGAAPALDRQSIPGAADVTIMPETGTPAAPVGMLGTPDTSDDEDMQRFLTGPLPGAAEGANPAPDDDSADMERFLRGPLPGVTNKPPSYNGKAVIPGREDEDEDQDIQRFIKQGMSNSLLKGLKAAIEMQESGGRGANTPVSVNGARGPRQIMPATFHQYAKPGENIDNPIHNRAVGDRIIEDLYNKYGDPRAVAAAYFSGKPNWRSQAADGNGKKTADYVQNIMNRLAAQGLQV